jgi:lipopolysaccharide export system protein LptC
MDDFSPEPGSRLSGLSSGKGRSTKVNHAYTRFIRSMRIILPLIAVGLTVVILTWEEAGRKVEPIKKEELVPQSANIQNELLKPVYNSVDANNQPFTVTADLATQDRSNPDLLNLQKPRAEMAQDDGSKINADANAGLYEQKTQKLNLEGDVHLIHSDGYTLSTEELRVDIPVQKAFSGRDVRVEGPAGTIDAKGLEGDGASGVLIFTGPAKVVLNSEGNMFQ